MSDQHLALELLAQLTNLNQQLSLDQQAFIEGNQTAIDAGNQQKIALMNTIDATVQQLQNTSLSFSEPVWLDIQKALQETTRLIDVNQLVIDANQTHYLNFVKALIHAASTEDEALCEYLPG